LTEPAKANAMSPRSSFTTGRRSDPSKPSNARARPEVLCDPCVLDGPREWVSAWRPPVPGVHEVFHARFVEHAYPAHTHDTWTVFVVEDGAIRYDLDATHRGVGDRRAHIL